MNFSAGRAAALIIGIGCLLATSLLTACGPSNQKEGEATEVVTCDGSQCNTTETTTPEDASTAERDCKAGSVGCRCTPTGACDKGLRCEEEVCQVCNEGSAGCPCKSGNKCNSGLKCEAGVCAGCVGKTNCPCHGNGGCDTGNKCVFQDTGESICRSCKGDKVDKTDCGCNKDSECGSKLLCVNFRCMDPATANKIPKSPKCYSPCESDVKMPDGTIRVCHPEYKLMNGCPVGQRCDEGSCLTQTQLLSGDQKKYPFCANDGHCPAWQACVGFRCYSTCRSSAECQGGFECHQYVCRRQCNVREKNCGNAYDCKTKGSDDGVCMPKATHFNKEPAKTTTPGTFKVAFRSLVLSKASSSQLMAITNDSKVPVPFTISRQKDTIGSKKPLSWLKIEECKTYSEDGFSCKTFTNKPSSKEPYTTQPVAPGKQLIIRVSNGAGKPSGKSTYEGTLTFKTDQLGSQQINVSYRESAAGRWQGQMVAFGNFDDTNIDKFPASKSVDLRSIKNAFLRRWLNFKRNELKLDQFLAMLRAVQEGTWKQKKVADDCRKAFSTQSSNDVVCYPYSSSKGYEILANSQREAPVPSGISVLDFAVNIQEKSSTLLEGRIVTSKTLQYSGNPRIQLGLLEKLSTKTLVPLKSLAATIDIGGRFYVDKDASCPDSSNFQKVTIPWLVPGFQAMSYSQPGSLFRSRYECRSKTVPQNAPSGASKELKEQIAQANISLSASNPVPNGWKLQRRLELIDGAVLDNQVIFAIYRERFVSFFNSNTSGSAGTLNKDFVNYGFLLLRRANLEIEPKDYVGTVSPSPKACSTDSQCSGGQKCQAGACRNPSRLMQVACTPGIVKAAMNRTIARSSDLRFWNGSDLGNLASALMGNQSAAVANNQGLHITRQENNGKVEYSYVRNGTKYFVHYYCEDTKQFNGGPTNNPQDCPPGSKVTFFRNTTTEETLRDNTCNAAAPASCDKVFAQLSTDPDFRRDVPFKCASTNQAFCENNRKDLREGKIFFKPATPGAFVSLLAPLRNALFEAFRYRIKFRSRTGKNVGFTPSICSKVASSQTPYCYDPAVIEELEQRVNCLEAIYTDSTINSRMKSTTKAMIKQFLQHAFSFSNRNVNGVILTDPGFETLNAELKVMLGDEAFTRSFASRYDLSNSNLVSFQGSLLEPNGIDASGALGYELYNLYLSTQYYQLVLDRFYSQSSVIYHSFRGSRFIGAASVTSYFQKLLLASTRKARSWSQIAKRYHALNRADLARHVIERAYAGTFMEMTILTRLLRELMLSVDPKELHQIAAEIDKVTLTYKAALLDMQETYKKLSTSINHFGIPEGYIPFPAMDTFSATSQTTNAFIVALQFAKEKLFIGKNKELTALQTKRSFDTSAAQFQSELVRIEKNYENQLADLCGNIEVTDANGQSRLFPAIPRYAALSPKTANLGDPCGKLQGGSIFNALAEIEKVRLSIMSLSKAQSNINAKITLEESRIKAYCDAKFTLAKITWDYRKKTNNLQLETEKTQQAIEHVQRAAQTASQAAELLKCSFITGLAAVGGDCGWSQARAIAGVLFVGAAQETAINRLNEAVNEKRKEQLELERQLEKTQITFECKACDAKDKNCKAEGTAQLESKIRIKELTSSLMNLHFEALKAQIDLQIAISNVTRLRQQAQRLVTQLDETTQLAINVQAAQNDPNIRIYKNDAIISAERTFEDAMREAYRTTLIYEYYTGTTYARKGDLYLIRMITAGDKNLEAYLSQLEQAFRDFEEQAGKPDIRVLVLSLRDHILEIPRTNEDGSPKDLNSRVAALQQALTDTNRLDANGYIAIPFEISVKPSHSLVSPITYNHKILYVEAEINSTSKGDDVARVYLRQKGTGMIRLKQDDDIKFYALPQRTAVINPFFNGAKVFAPDIYRNFRLRDRPLGNTRWELLFNQASEKANQDINLNSISDITLYIYYTDFTKED